MYKVIFSDMDSTLLCDDKSICKRNVEAIKKAEELGVHFVLCTGRVAYGIKQFADVINISNAVTTNGSLVYSDGKKIRSNCINREDAINLVNYAIDNDEYLRLFAEDCLYCMNVDKNPVNSNYYNIVENITKEKALEFAKTLDIIKIGFFQKRERCIEMREDFKKIAPNVDALFSGKEFLDIVVKGDDKGVGAKAFCEYNHIDLSEAIGIGDEENDHSMLKMVGLSCAPINATKQTKDICKYITTANNNEGAVAEVIEKFILNNQC